MDGIYTKIVIVSLSSNFTRKVGRVLSQKLEMLFCDVKDLLEYELVDANALKEFCTTDFLQQSERNVFKRLASFENVVVAIDCDSFLQNIDLLKENSLIIFLHLSKALLKQFNEKINLIAYDGRTQSLQQSATITQKVISVDDEILCQQIFEKLGGIL